MQAIEPIVCPQAYKPESLMPQSDATPSDYTSVAQLYSAMRLFGTPSAARIAAGQSDQTPLTTRVSSDGTRTLQPVNYTGVDTAMSGRFDKDMERGAMRDSSYRLLPGTANGFRGPVRAEQYIGTTSSRTEYGEITNLRPNTASYQPRTLNLTPVSANAECRAREVQRLNRLNDAYVEARIKSVL